MKLDPLLSKAARQARRRDYEGALKTLRAEEDRYYGSFKYYYLYAVICLHSGAFVEALTNFRQAKKIKLQDPDTLLGLAALYLKRMDTVQAVDHYLDVQEFQPKNRIAKRALSVIRKHSGPEELSEWLVPERLVKLFPPIPFGGITFKMAAAGISIFAVSIFLLSGILVQLRVMQNPFRQPSSRPTHEFVLDRQQRTGAVEAGGFYRYILTQAQVLSHYNRALSLFTSYRDELAKTYLNRILESNASEAIRNNALIMKSLMDVPGFNTFRRGDNFSYSEVRSEPAIFRDVHVIWRGMATNVIVTDEYTRFHFLVGYDTRIVLEGIVPVIFDHPIAVNPERPLEVLGRIVLNEDLSFSLHGVSIHQTGRLE